jgi:prepilin-type N-terminal cleavage/methylation domain-containing protein
MTKQEEKYGFTLVEVLVALAILSIGIISIMQLFPQSVRQARVAAERTSVASLAKTELGRVKAGGVFSQNGTSGFDAFMAGWASSNALNSLTEAQRAFALYDSSRATVQRINSVEEPSLFRITYSVTMTDGRVEEFVTYVTEL